MHSTQLSHAWAGCAGPPNRARVRGMGAIVPARSSSDASALLRVRAGCLCPVFSLSLARIHLMHSKRIRPDPMDYQIIASANCLQLLACLFDILAIFISELREAACALMAPSGAVRQSALQARGSGKCWRQSE